MKENTVIFWRSALFNLVFWAETTVQAILCTPVMAAPPRANYAVGRAWAYHTLFIARAICGIHHEIRGMENVSEHGVIYACKHQSAWDTAIFWLLFRYPCFVLKRSLTYIPFFGWYLVRQKQVAIDRSAGVSAAKQMIRDVRQRLWDRQPVIIFPEGTRTPPGAAPVYHPGIAALYAQIKVPVIPVALNSGLCWGRNAFLKRPGTIVLEFLPPIEPGLPPKEFLALLQTTIESATARLIEEGHGKRDNTMLYFNRSRAQG